MDMVASKVVQKYQTSTCEQLWQKKSAKAPPSAEEQKVLGILKSDPQIRTMFIDKVAAPIANKMFECGMIPYLSRDTNFETVLPEIHYDPR